MMKPSWHPVQKARVQVHGESINLAYTRGSAEGPGTPVILVHGMGSSRLAYEPLLNAWPLPNPVYAVDLPGFGASPQLRQRQTERDYVEALHAFIDAVALDSVVLLGHSFGGMVVGDALACYPQSMKGAILVASAGFVPPSNVLQPSRSVCLNRLGIWITGFSYFGDRMVSALGMDPKTLTEGDRRRLRYGWRRAIEMARMGRFYESPKFFQGIVEVKRPVVLIHGERDPVFSLPKIREVVRDRFPILAMPEVGHLPFDQDLAGFLERLVEAMAVIEA